MVQGADTYRDGGHPASFVELQLAGSAPAAWRVAQGSVQALRAALAADYVLVAAYVPGLVVLCLLGAAVSRRRHFRNAALTAAWGAVSIAVLECVENGLVARGLSSLPGGTDTPWAIAATADVLKWTLLLPVTAVALVALLTVLRRATRRITTMRRGPSPCFVARPAESAGLPAAVQEDRPTGKTAICVSGGGIRSATVALGALQILRPKWFDPEGYLFSVSGGGYFSGALRLAMQPDPMRSGPKPTSVSAAERAALFSDDSPELSHLRRNSRYIADTAGQWIMAAGSVLLHLLYSLALIAAVAAASGLLLGELFRSVPLVGGAWVSFPPPRVRADPLQPEFLDAFTMRSVVGPNYAVALLAAVAVMLVLLTGSVRAMCGEPAPRLQKVAGGAVALLVLTLAVTSLVPALVSALALQEWFPDDAAKAGTTGGVGAFLATLVTAVMTLASKRTSEPAAPNRLGLPAGLVLRVIVVGVVAALVLAAFVVVATTAHAVITVGWDAPAVWGTALIVGIALLAGVAFDQTQTTLHPFYRRRISTAFAVRRVACGRVRPYPWTERTDLIDYAARVQGQPRVVFVASVQRSRGAGTAPGRGASPFSLAADWVGGPDVGYVRTRDYVSRAPRSYRADLTVLGAMAISGAAIASAMGRAAAPFQVLLAISNARLGAWLPNPRWLAQEGGPEWTWKRRGLPRWRRETYHAREIFGRYSDDDPLVLVTDGGHYDNLALVEALRHECSTVIVVDAGGDDPTFPSDLITAIELARDALGVEIELDDVSPLRPGTAYPDDPTVPLAPRMSDACTVTGRIEYRSGRTGSLIVAKTRLTSTLPTEVIAYASTHAAFPHDSTADQWFDHDQFEAYYRLGMHLGAEADGAAVVAGCQAPATTPASSALG